MAAAGQNPAFNTAVPFLGLGRARGCVTLAFCCVTDDEKQSTDCESTFKKLLGTVQTKRMKAGQRTRLQWNACSICCLVDQQGEYLAVAVTSSLEYPERVAYQMLQELLTFSFKVEAMDSAGHLELNDVIVPHMKELMAKYERPGSDEMSAALEKVNVVKSVMQDNLRQAQETGQNMSDLQARTGNMEERAKMFHDASDQAAAEYRWKRLQMYGMMGGAAVLILLLLIWLIFR